MEVTYKKGEILVIVTHTGMDSCDYVIHGNTDEVSENDLLVMADMMIPEGWEVI